MPRKSEKNFMQEGAFGLIDCLGWKGIWQHRAGPEAILRKISEIRKKIDDQNGEYTDALSKASVKAQPELLFLSDTVVLSVPLVQVDGATIDERRGFSIEIAIKTVMELIDLYVDEEPYIGMRGCVTYGKHLLSENTFLGPAIDTVAGEFELANGAFVWLDSEASKVLKSLRDAKKSRFARTMISAERDLGKPLAERIIKAIERIAEYPIVIDDYPLPLKDGNKLNCPVVNPLALRRDPIERANSVARYEASFNNPSIDVILKKQNTMEFLRTADAVTAKFLEGAFDDEVIKALGQSFGVAPNFGTGESPSIR